MTEYEFTFRIAVFRRRGKINYNLKRVRFSKEDDAYAIAETTRILERECVRRGEKVYPPKYEKLLRLEEVPMAAK